jgi:hypothetical protein
MRILPVQVRRIRLWWEYLYRSLGAGGWDEDETVDSRWPAGLQDPIRGRTSKMMLKLDVSDWLQRRTFFSGLRGSSSDLSALACGSSIERTLRTGDSEHS